MSNWELIFREAERLATQLTQKKVDLAEAEKLLAYFVYKEFNSEDVRDYLDEMSCNPPPRSQRSKRHFQSLKTIWDNWHFNGEGEEKARVWGWAIREAKVKRWT